MNNHDTVKVWDGVVRVFHWSLVAAFFTAYLSEGEPHWLHVWAGYLALALLAVRLLWGVVGTRHARFADFVRTPRAAWAYLGAALRGRARRYLGHNPAGGLMIVALLLMVAATGASGLALLAAADGAGPLAGLVASGLEEPLEEVHEVLANLTVALVVLHVLGVILGSVSHRENLVGAMWHGFKRRDDASV